MEESPDPQAEAMCPGCGRSNALASDFFANCMAPLTWHATTDPFQTIFSEGYAARRALSQSPRPIIVIGVWLWMVPLAIVSLAGLVFVLASFLHGLFTFQLGHVIVALFGAIPASIGLYISGPLLYRVTRGNRPATGTSAGGQVGSATDAGSASDLHQAEQEEDGESLTCLECGQQIQAGAARCPGCGWSYAEKHEADSGPDASPPNVSAG
jgi:hypothetical protein